MTRDFDLTPSAVRRMGKRAAEAVRAHGMLYSSNRDVLVPDGDVPDGVAKTLTRLYGRADTIERGETAYWTVPPRDFTESD